MAPDFPPRIGSYDVTGILGSGRLGTLYKAFDQAHARVVCVRVLSPGLLADAPRLEQFRRAFRASVALIHDNLLRAYGEGQDGDLVYTVVEYVDGGGLADRLQGSRLTLAEAIRVVDYVTDGLGVAHRAGLVHGDLNPRNVLVSKDLSVVKIGEFGTAEAAPARATDRTTTLAFARISSQLYRAPELAGGDGQATVRSDIYSLGVIAYEAMTGKLPLGRFSLPSDANNQVPLTLDPIVLRCLATDPSQRYQNVAALVAELNTVEEVVDFRLLSEVKRLSAGRLFRTKKTTDPGRKRPARIPRYLGVAALVLVAAAAAAVLLLRGPGGLLSKVGAPKTTAGQPTPAPAAPPAAQAPLLSSALPGIAILEVPMTAAPPLSATVPEPAAPSPRAAAPSQPTAPTPTALAASPTTQPGPGRAGPSPAGGVESANRAETPPLMNPPRAAVPKQGAGALFTEAQSLIKKGQDVEARTKLALVGEHYSQTPWFVPAMMVKIDLEDRRALRELDPAIGQTAPASVQTKRLLIERAPHHPASEAALWQLGEFYRGIQQYAMAVQSYVQLATRFPNTRLEAWFKAGEIDEQQLKKRADARAAYLKVPATSPHFEEAQARAKQLAGR